MGTKATWSEGDPDKKRELNQYAWHNTNQSCILATCCKYRKSFDIIRTLSLSIHYLEAKMHRLTDVCEIRFHRLKS